MKVITIKEHHYADKLRTIGEIYEAQAQFVRTLLAYRFVKIAEAEPEPQSETKPARKSK